MAAFENPERVTSFADQNPGREVVTMRTYDDIADWYDRWVGTHSMREDPFFPACEQLMGEVEGARILPAARAEWRGIWQTWPRASSVSTSQQGCLRSCAAMRRPPRDRICPSRRPQSRQPGVWHVRCWR